MKKTLNRGFTLIELLVVIAIIGILASVVLASLNTARAKGADAAIKANLANTRAQAEIIYDTDGDYDAVCAANGETQNAQIAAAVTAAAGASNGTVVCAAPASGAATSWAISSPLKTDPAVFWCVDSAGAAKQIGAQIAATAASC